jgi:hypothetical protein
MNKIFVLKKVVSYPLDVGEIVAAYTSMESAMQAKSKLEESFPIINEEDFVKIDNDVFDFCQEQDIDSNDKANWIDVAKTVCDFGENDLIKAYDFYTTTEYGTYDIIETDLWN